jgi:hypothetical protein
MKRNKADLFISLLQNLSSVFAADLMSVLMQATSTHFQEKNQTDLSLSLLQNLSPVYATDLMSVLMQAT